MVKFDWEVESKYPSHNVGFDETPSSNGEASDASSFPFTLMLILLMLSGVVGFAMYRLEQVHQTIENRLHETVKAEVSFLRLGDRTQFLAVQRSASPSWVEAQTIRYEDYQYLKTQHLLNLNTEIISSTIDGSRARIQLTEQIDGQTYLQTWFYWNYQDGWRHVPIDYTFWGEPQTQTGEYITLLYSKLDHEVATQLYRELEQGLARVCIWIACEPFVLRVVSREGIYVNWSEAIPNQLEVSSPYIERVDLQQPIPETLMNDITIQIAKRLAQANGAMLEVDALTDRAFIENQLIDYIQSHLFNRDSSGNLFADLNIVFENPRIQEVLVASSQSHLIPLLHELLTQPSPSDMPITWESYANWLLNVEYTYWTIGDVQGFNALYLNDSVSQLVALTHYSALQFTTQPFNACQWNSADRLTCTTLDAQQVEYQWQFENLLRVN